MTRPHLSQWVSGGATVLVVALVATPVWDFWHYRGLRSGPGPGLAVGLILPPAAPPRRALVAGLIAPSPIPARQPDAAATRPVSATVEASLSTTASPARPAAQAATAPAVPAPARSVGSRRAHPVPAAAPSALPEPAGTNVAAVTPGSGWLLTSPAAPPTTQTGKPSPPPDPQPAPPPPRHLDPVPSVAEPHPVPQALPVLSLGPPPDDVAIGQDVVVDVRLNSARDITSLPFHVQFDPAVVEFVSASQGSALSSLQPVLLASVNPARPGDLAVGLSFVDAGGTFNGSGSILSLHFRALASGVSPLTFDRASVRGATSQPLQAQFESASVRVR